MYRLVIAEKSAVAMSIAKALGATVRKEGHMEGGCWLVSWCVGHLAGLADAETYDPNYAKWRREDLPISPENWRFTVGKASGTSSTPCGPCYAGRTCPRW